MNGTLAIWYEPEQDLEPPSNTNSERPKLEIHFNLWRDNPSKTNFLDVGLKVSGTALFKRIYLYFPVEIQLDQLQDLSEVMTFGQTLDAVFNSVVEIREQTDLKYATWSNGKHFVTVHSMAVGSDVKLSNVEDGLKGPGSTLTFTEDFCRRLRAAGDGDQYMRIRLHLSGPSKTLFTQEIAGRDEVFASSSQRLELTELRLNEQRSFPPSIARKAQANSFKIVRVHYFLIRELGHALITQHAPLRKVRRLEAKLWASYLRGMAVPTKRAAEEERLLSRLVIYHWREGDEAKPIEDFTAFASFQASTPGLLFYIIGITLLGAIGGALGDWGKNHWGGTPALWIWCAGVALLWIIARTGLWARLEQALGRAVRFCMRRISRM